MAVALSTILLLLCAAGPALSSHDVDCSNETMQGAWLLANTPLTCVTALSSLRINTEFTPANVAHVKTVCDSDDCGRKFVEWLEGEECHDQPIAERTALEFSRTVCASFNGSLDGNCLFSNATGRVDRTVIGTILQNCSAWWLGAAQGRCPPGICASTIQTAVDRVKCCYNNFFSTKTAVDMLTGLFKNLTRVSMVSAVNLTDPALLSACNISNPGICQSALTEAALGTAASIAVAIASMLVAIVLQ